ncbi:MAG: cupin-like domain-containing protein [Steroidobacteraceae bacterium]
MIKDWPAVHAALQSPVEVSRYLMTFDNGSPVDAILMPPQANGQIFYNEAMDGFNFARNRLPVSAIIEQLSRYALFESPPSVAVQSALIPDCLPGFAAENSLPILDQAVAPRIWLGNRITVPAHFDESDNVACVVAGRRRFTLFPPEQVANLYVGPLDFAPTGAAMSMVQFARPDFGKFPKFKAALSAAFIAELGPGDAVFIPTLWWHHVESLDQKLNVLVNYWWKGALGAVERTASAMECLLHSLLNVKPLPSELRKAWASLFHHYVFDASDDNHAHIPANRRGVLGEMSPEAANRIRSLLIANLQR